MSRHLVLVALAAIAAGCKSEPAGPPAAPAAPVETHILAVEPIDMAREAPLQPKFRWKLPPALSHPSLVSFALAEMGQGDQPLEQPGADRQIAFASGLHDTSPTALDPFRPPAGCVLTGELRDAKTLKPGTWYRWTVRAVGAEAAQQADFFFRTQDAAPTPPK